MRKAIFFPFQYFRNYVTLDQKCLVSCQPVLHYRDLSGRLHSRFVRFQSEHVCVEQYLFVFRSSFVSVRLGVLVTLQANSTRLRWQESPVKLLVVFAEDFVLRVECEQT